MSKVLVLEFGSYDPILPERWEDLKKDSYKYCLKFSNGVYILTVSKK